MGTNEEINEEINEEVLAGRQYGAGMVKDPVTGMVLLLWIKIHRDTFQKCDYIIPADSPEELKECLKAMKTVIKDKPIISVKLMKEEDILTALDGKEESENYRRFSAMAICALNQAFEDHMRKRYSDNTETADKQQAE